MADELDPEPVDKRTSAWKEWASRHASSEPKRAIMPDPNVFAAALAAGMETSPIGHDGKSALLYLQDRWHIHRQFVEWVASGEDMKAFNAMMSAERAREEKKARQERLDREGEEARMAASKAAMGAA